MSLYTWGGEPSAMIGETLTSIEGLVIGSESAVFRTASGRVFEMRYDHDCCAGCSIEDVCGDANDLIGEPIVMAEDVSNKSEVPAPVAEKRCWDESKTWTFVKFATTKGYVTVRWYGSSNGYYSESPSWYEHKEDKP